MTRHLDAAMEERDARRHEAIIRAVEFDLLRSVEVNGTSLQGFSVRLNDWECLITLRATRGGVREVCFVGAQDLGGCLIKCVREAKREKLHWKQDRFAE